MRAVGYDLAGMTAMGAYSVQYVPHVRRAAVAADPVLLIVLGLFAGQIVLNVAFVKLSVGLPLKDVALLGLTGLLFLAYNKQTTAFLNAHSGLALVFCSYAALGFSLSLLNDAEIGPTFESFLRLLVQPFLILLCTYVVASVAGLRFVVVIFLASALITGAFAILQTADIGFGWKMRAILGSLQNEPGHITENVAGGIRPPGLSLTPIMFSYHIATAYITAQFLYRRELITSKAYNILVAALTLMALANETRSLLIGMVVHEFLLRCSRLNLKTFLGLAALALVGAIAMLYLESIDSRITSYDDPSAIGRIVLYYYGLQLAADNPFGYGWEFDAASHAWLYWELISGVGRAEAAFRLEIHNAYLSFFIAYGILGVLILVVCTILEPVAIFSAIGFSIAYLINAFFHNGGILMGEAYVWYGFAIFLFVNDHIASRRAHPDDRTLGQPEPTVRRSSST